MHFLQHIETDLCLDFIRFVTYSVVRIKFVFKIVEAEYVQHGPQKYEAMVLKSTKLTGNRDSNETMQVSEIASACICKRVLTICKVCLKI